MTLLYYLLRATRGKNITITLTSTSLTSNMLTFVQNIQWSPFEILYEEDNNHLF